MTGDIGVSVEPGIDILAASEASKKIDDPWGRLHKQRIYKPDLIMAILIPFFQQFSKMNVVMFFAPVIFKILGFGIRTALVSAVITFGVYMLAAIASFYLVDKKGRSFLVLVGGVQMAVFQFIFEGLIIWNKFGDSNAIVSRTYAIMVILCYFEFVQGFAFSCDRLRWLVPSEFPLEVLSASQRINVCVNKFLTFFIALIFSKMFNFGRFFFFFGVFGIIMNIFMHNFLPETKGIPIEEMSQVWKSHWYWKRFTDGDDYELEQKKVQ